jgi:large subunit ribosomal protein L15
MPIYMRVGKQRGPTSKDAMPIGPHRTYTVPVNIRDLERVFENGDTVSIETLLERGLIKHTRYDVKVLGFGDLTKSLSVTAHRFSQAAREKIQAAGGTATALREPAAKRAVKRRAKRPARETAPAEVPATEDTASETAEE